MQVRLTHAAGAFLILTVGHVLVSLYDYYNEVEWSDALLHAIAGSAMALLWLWVFQQNYLERTIGQFSAIMAAVFGSFLWEIWEFAYWNFFPLLAGYEGRLDDTLADIMMGMIGGAFVALVDNIITHAHTQK